MKHVVALSGGKDSTAMALRLAEIEPRDYVYVCTPTGDEPNEMFGHWRNLSQLLGKPIVPVLGGSLKGLIESQNALPNFRQRWCTRMLKIEPFAAFMLQNRPATSYVGLRADEEEREGGDYRDLPGVIMDFPMRRWGLEDVICYLAERGVNIPKRTDCRKCFFQRLIEWYEHWRDDPESWFEGEYFEMVTGRTFRSPGRDTWPLSMAGLRARFEAGDVPKDTRDSVNALKCRVCRL
jgi:hypothetical protein